MVLIILDIRYFHSIHWLKLGYSSTTVLNYVQGSHRSWKKATGPGKFWKSVELSLKI